MHLPRALSLIDEKLRRHISEVKIVLIKIQHIQVGYEVELLKDKAQMLRTETGPLITRKTIRVSPFDQYLAGIGAEQSPRHQQQFLRKLQIRYSQKDQKRRKFQWGYASLVYLFRIST